MVINLTRDRSDGYRAYADYNTYLCKIAKRGGEWYIWARGTYHPVIIAGSFPYNVFYRTCQAKCLILLGLEDFPDLTIDKDPGRRYRGPWSL